jgi:lipoprotein-anchoring transpeptidase ErfK/SrfK
MVENQGGRRFMKLLSGGRLALAAAFAMSVLVVAPARADVVVHIDKSSQHMSVSVDGAPRYSWPISTGRSGYGTPSGVFHPQMMARRWFSKKYYNSPMPHSIFFYYGFAIHGTNDLRRLGGPASHGCVRLHPSHAATLYVLVERNGRSNTRIVISN